MIINILSQRVRLLQVHKAQGSLYSPFSGEETEDTENDLYGKNEEYRKNTHLTIMIKKESLRQESATAGFIIEHFDKSLPKISSFLSMKASVSVELRLSLR